MKIRLLLAVIVGAVFALTACEVNNISNAEIIEGSGNVITTEHEVNDFSRIQINLGADLMLTQGEGESLTIEADDNLMQYIETEIRQGQLIISTPDNVSLNPSQSIQLSIGFEALSQIEINGRSAITAGSLDLDALSIVFNGAGATRLVGRVDNQEITVRGMAIINNYDLVSQQVRLDISGNGTVEVHAEDTLDVTIAGSGNIHYTGDPTVTENISGSGSITQAQ